MGTSEIGGPKRKERNKIRRWTSGAEREHDEQRRAQLGRMSAREKEKNGANGRRTGRLNKQDKRRSRSKNAV